MNPGPEVGDKSPDFTLQSTIDDRLTLGDYRGRKNVVLAFYLLDWTSVCTKEMCTFRDRLQELRSHSAEVLGISVDSIFAHRAFAKDENIEYPLLSDFNREVVRKYGVLKEFEKSLGYRNVAQRSVFVVNKEGIVRYKWVADHPSQEPKYDEIREVLEELP